MHMKEEPIAYRNVALLLRHDQAKEGKLIQWSTAIGEQITSDILLNRENMLAHISLYNVPYPERNLLEVASRLQKLSSTLSPIELQFDRTSRVDENVFVDAVITDALRDLHERLIATLNELREGQVYPGALEATANNPRQRSNVIETGMRLSREDFQPHVTVAHTQTEGEAEAARLILPRRINIKTLVPSLHLVETGAWGTCKNILQEFSLLQAR